MTDDMYLRKFNEVRGLYGLLDEYDLWRTSFPWPAVPLTPKPGIDLRFPRIDFSSIVQADERVPPHIVVVKPRPLDFEDCPRPHSSMFGLSVQPMPIVSALLFDPGFAGLDHETGLDSDGSLLGFPLQSMPEADVIITDDTAAVDRGIEALAGAHDDHFWPHKGGCPLCGSDAYVGFVRVECSNGGCGNFFHREGM